MTALIIIGAILALIVFLLTRFAGIILRYDDEMSVTVTYGLIRYRLGKKKKAKKPKKPKEKKPKKKKKKKEEEPAAVDDEAAKAAEKQKKREKREALFELIREVKRILPKFVGKIHFRSAKLHVRVATGDAASTALACGGAKASASILFELIDHFAVLERGSAKNVAIEPDFTSDEMKYDVDVRFRLRVIWAIHYGLKVLLSFIKTKIKKSK